MLPVQKEQNKTISLTLRHSKKFEEIKIKNWSIWQNLIHFN